MTGKTMKMHYEFERAEKMAKNISFENWEWGTPSIQEKYIKEIREDAARLALSQIIEGKAFVSWSKNNKVRVDFGPLKINFAKADFKLEEADDEEGVSEFFEIEESEWFTG